MELIPHKQATGQQKLAWEKCMMEGNTLLRAWHKKCKEKRHKRESGNYSRLNFLRDLLAKVPDNNPKVIYIFGHRIPKAEVEKILLARDLQWPLLEAYSKMITDLAATWSRKTPVWTLEELRDLAIDTFLDSTVYYLGKNKKGKRVRFTTYSYTAVRRRMIRAVHRERTRFSSLDSDSAELFGRYQHLVCRAERRLNFDEIVERLELDETERIQLQAMLVKVYNHSSVSSSLREEDGTLDYGQLSIKCPGVNGDIRFTLAGQQSRGGSLLHGESTEGVAIDVIETISRAGLTDLEHKVVEAFMADGQRNWQAELARKLKNPKTGENYSRMAITFAWRHAQEKLAKSYSA